MDALLTFAQGLLDFALLFVTLIIDLFLYVLAFFVQLLQQLLGSME